MFTSFAPYLDLLRFGIQPFETLERLAASAQEQGGFLRFKLWDHGVCIVGTSAAARKILVEQADAHDKGPVLGILKEFLGEGLLTAEGPSWREARTAFAPTFSLSAIQNRSATQITEVIQTHWDLMNGAPEFDLAEFCKKISLEVLFVGILSPHYRLGKAVDQTSWLALTAEIAQVFESAMTPLGFLFGGLSRRRKIAALKLRMQLLLEGSNILDRDVAQFFTLIMAGHETTASVLTWALEHWARLGSPSDLRDQAPLRRAWINRTLQNTPPVWAIVRRNILTRELIVIPVFAIQNQEPDLGAKLAFGLGPRACIGAGFAQWTLDLILKHAPTLTLSECSKNQRLTRKASLSCSPKQKIWVTATFEKRNQEEEQNRNQKRNSDDD